MTAHFRERMERVSASVMRRVMDAVRNAARPARLRDDCGEHTGVMSDHKSAATHPATGADELIHLSGIDSLL